MCLPGVQGGQGGYTSPPCSLGRHYPQGVSSLQNSTCFQLASELKSLSHVRLFATPWTVAYQAPPSLEFSRHEYWSGLPFPSPEDLPDPEIKPGSPALQADAIPSEPPGEASWPLRVC